jgi:hypothetical protein
MRDSLGARTTFSSDSRTFGPVDDGLAPTANIAGVCVGREGIIEVMPVRQRNILIASALALAALVLALLVVPRAAPGPVATSPTPSGTPTTASGSPATTVAAASASPTSPGATPTAGATGTGAPAAAGYGYVVIGGGGLAVIDESGKTIQQHACGIPSRGCGQQLVAVSPDGRRVAFWRAGQGSRWELATFEAATPANVRGVATLPEGFEGQTVLWATDSRGLLFSAQTEGYGGIRGGPGKATISGLDATTPAPAVDVLPARTDGFFYVPVAWDRAKDIVAAVTTGEGGFVGEYVVNVGGRTTATRAEAGQFGAFRVLASPDGARVLTSDGSTNTLQVWPVADFGARFKANPGTNVPRITGALWRTSSEIAWSYGDRLDVFILQSEGTKMVYTAPGVRLVALRPDGSAALVASGGQLNVSAGMFIVDIATGRATSLGAMDVAQVVVPRGVLLR